MAETLGGEQSHHVLDRRGGGHRDRIAGHDPLHRRRGRIEAGGHHARKDIALGENPDQPAAVHHERRNIDGGPAFKRRKAVSGSRSFAIRIA